MRLVSEWKLLISIVALTLHHVQGTIVKDATLSNIAFENARKSNLFNSNVTEFQPADIIFTENKPHTCLKFLKLLAETKYALTITVYTSKGSESLQNFIQSEPTSNFRLAQDNRTLAFLDIAAMLDMREVSFIRPTHLNVNGNSIPLSNAIDIYASDLKPSIAVRYMNNDEYFFYENKRVGATQLYNIIFQRPNYVYDFSSLELNGMKIPFKTILYTLAYMPNLKIIYEGEKFDVMTFMAEYPQNVGKLQLELEGVIDDLIDVFKKVLKYTVVDLITVPTGMVPPYYALRSLQHLSELEAWRPGPGNNPKPIPLFLRDVYPDEDPKQNLIQVLYRGALLSVQSFLQLLLTEGHIVFGDMAYAEKLPRDQDYIIRYDNYTFSIDSFLTTYGRTDAYYEVIKGSKILTLKQLDALEESAYSIPAKKPEISIVSKYGVSFRNSELAYNLAQQKPRHVMIVYDGVSYTPEQFVHIFRDQMPEEFTVQQNGIDVSLHEIFKIIDINLTPQFLKLYKVMNVPHKSQVYTKDDILVAILENPEGFMIYDNEQFKSPINFKEHYGDNVPEYVIYYKDMPIKPQDIPKYLDLEAILEEEFYPILYNGNTYQPKDVVNMLYNQQPDKVKILHKEQQYTPEEYKDQFPSTKFQVLYNDYPIQAQDLEQILDFDLKNPKSQLRFFTIKYKGVSYLKEDIIDILIEQSPPNVKILHEGIFYLPKQFKRKFGSNIPSNFAVVQNRRIIPSKLLPTIVRLGDSKQTNPKIFPNIIYGGKEYTPDDILQLIITQNPPDVTIALRNKKYTPKQFERTYDGVYPITFSILFKNTVITPEEIVNIVDFETSETTEPPKIIIYTTQRGQKWMPTATTSTSSESTKSVEASTASTGKTIRIVEEDDLTTIGGNPKITLSKYSQENSAASRWAESEEVSPGMHHKENLARGGQPPEDINLKVEDVGSSKDFNKSHDFPYIVHDGTLYAPADVIKSMAEVITKGILPETWKIHHKNIDYSPVEFITKFKPIPRNFQIFKDNEKISPEQIANLINLKNYGFVINEEMPNGTMFPHLVINGVIYTPQEILHCLITKSSNETYILHQGRIYHPKTFQEEYENQPLPNFDVIVRNETIPKEKLLSIANSDDEFFLTTAWPLRTTPISKASPIFVSDEAADSSSSSRDQEASTVSVQSTEKQYTLTKHSDTTINQPKVSSEEYTESMVSAISYELTTEAPIVTTAKQFPYIVYNGSIFSPYEVVKTLRDQKPGNVTIVADHQEYTPEEFYDHYVTDNPEQFKIFHDGNYVSPSEIPKIVNFDSSTYGSYDYEYDDRLLATPKPTVSTNIIKQILKDNPNTRVVLEGREYEPEEIDDWDKIHIGQKDVKIVEVEPTLTTFLPNYENYLQKLNKTPKGKFITIRHDDTPYTLENFLKLFQNRIPENIRVVDGSKEIPIEKIKDLLLPFRNEIIQPLVSPITPRVDNEHSKTISGDNGVVRSTVDPQTHKKPSPIDVFISKEGPDLEGPGFGLIKLKTTQYPMTDVTGTKVPDQVDDNSSHPGLKSSDFDSVIIQTTHNPMSNHPTNAESTVESDNHKTTDGPVINLTISSTTLSYSSEENYDYEKYTPSSELTIEAISNAHPTERPANSDSSVEHGITSRYAGDQTKVYEDVSQLTYEPTLPSQISSFSSDAAFFDDGDSNDFKYYSKEFITPHHITDKPQKHKIVENKYSTDSNDNMRTTPDYNLPEKPSTETMNVNEEHLLHQKSDKSSSKIPTNEEHNQSTSYLLNQSTTTYISEDKEAEIGKYPSTTSNYKYSAENSTLSTESYNQSDEMYSEQEPTVTILNHRSKHREYPENVHKPPIYSSIYGSLASDEINRPEYPNHKATTAHPLINDGRPYTESTIKPEFTYNVPTRTYSPGIAAITTPRHSQISEEMEEVPTQRPPGQNPSITIKPTNPRNVDLPDYKLPDGVIMSTIPYSAKNITSTMPTRSSMLEEYESGSNAPIFTDSSTAFSQPDELSSETMKLTPLGSSAHTTISAPIRSHHGDMPNIPVISEYPENIEIDNMTLPNGMTKPVIPNNSANSEVYLPTIPFSTQRLAMPEGDDLISTDVHKLDHENVLSILTTPEYSSEEDDIYDVTPPSNITEPIIPFSSQLQQPSKATGLQTEIHRPTNSESSEHSTIPVPLRFHPGNIPSIPTEPVQPEFSNIYDGTLPNSATKPVMPDSNENIKLQYPLKPSIMPLKPTMQYEYDIISTKPNKPTYSDNSEYSIVPVPTQPHRDRIFSVPTKREYSEEGDIYEDTVPSNIQDHPTKHAITKIRPRLPNGYDITSEESDRQSYSDSSEYSSIPIPSNEHGGHVPSVPIKPGNPQLTDIYNISLPNGMTDPAVPNSSQYIEIKQPTKPSTTPIKPIMREEYNLKPNMLNYSDSSEHSAIPIPTKSGHISGKPEKPSSQYTEAKLIKTVTRPQIPEKYNLEPNRPTYSATSEHSTIPVPAILRQDDNSGRPTEPGYPETDIYNAAYPNRMTKPTKPHNTDDIEVYQPFSIPIMPTIPQDYNMIYAGPNRPKYPYSSKPDTMPGYREPIDIIRPSMPHSNKNIDVFLPIKSSIMPTRPVDIYNKPSGIKLPLNNPSSRDQTFEEYSIKNFDKFARLPISLESTSSTNHPSTWAPEISNQLNKFIGFNLPTTVHPLYTIGTTGHLDELIFTTPTAQTVYYEGKKTTPKLPIAENPIKPTTSTFYNSLIVTDEDVLDTIDIIHNLVAHNPNRVEVLYNDNPYKPEEFIKKYPYLPNNPDVKYVIGNNVVSPFYVASQFPPKPKSSNDTIFPNVIKDGHTYSPKDVLKEISHNPEGQCVEVVYNGQLYTPKQFYDLFQSNPHFPNNFQMQVSGQPLDPKLFLSIFKVLGKTGKISNDNEINMIENDEVGYPYIAKWPTTTQKPTIVGTYIHKVMSKEPNFMIIYEDNTYDPLEYLEVFEENAPGNFKILYEDKILTPKNFYQLIKHRPPQKDNKIPDQQFPQVSFEGQQYSPRLVLESLAVSNPNHVKVKHQGKLYTPMQLIASFNTIPTAFELVDSTGNTINPMQTSEYLPGSFNSGRKSAPIENNNFPTIVSNGEIFTPKEILVNIQKSGSNVLVRLNSGRTLSAWQVLSMQAMPEKFDLIMNGKKIEPIEIARIIKLQKY